MKKFVYIAVLLTFINISSFAQKWQQLFGLNNYSEHVMDLTEAYDKGYLINGDFEDNEKNWLIKTDINGNILWDKYFIWSDNGYLYWGYVDQDGIGNTYVSCQFSKPGIGTWPLVLKINPCGELVWSYVYADYDYDFGSPYDMIVKENGDVYILTQYESEEQLDQTFICHISSEGFFQWKQSIASSSVYPLIDSRVCERLNFFNDHYLVSGYCYYPNPGNPGVVYLRPFFVMLDNEFNELWALPYGVSKNILGSAYNTIAINDTLYMGVGTKIFTENGGPLLNNGVLMFFNDKGQELNYNQIHNEDIGANVWSNFIIDIRRINDTLFMTAANFGEDTQGNPYGELVIDTSGNIYYSQSKLGTRGLSKVIKTYDGKYVFTTSYRYPNAKYDIMFYKENEKLEDDTIYNQPINYDSLCSYQITSGTIDLTGSTIITDVSEYPTHDDFLKRQNKVSIKVVPNPSDNGLVNILISNVESYHELELDVFNIFGQKVHHATFEKETESILINTQEWPSGIYLVTLFNQNRSIGQAKMIIQ